MAIFYYDDYSKLYQSRNFGDDINPFLLSRLFPKSLIHNQATCLIGIGTLLYEDTVDKVRQYDHKIVFSSGAPHEYVGDIFDDSWDFICVRRPKTAASIGLSEGSDICDGAVLLSDFFPPMPSAKRNNVVLIPHINSGWAAGLTLNKICAEIGIQYLSPDEPSEVFINTVRSASLVMTEAMHGAILADTMRTPWIPFNLHFHNGFKWEDWFASIRQPYESHSLTPKLEDCDQEHDLDGHRKWLEELLKKNIQRILEQESPILSDEELLNHHKSSLYAKIETVKNLYPTRRITSGELSK